MVILYLSSYFYIPACLYITSSSSRRVYIHTSTHVRLLDPNISSLMHGPTFIHTLYCRDTQPTSSSSSSERKASALCFSFDAWPARPQTQAEEGMLPTQANSLSDKPPPPPRARRRKMQLQPHQPPQLISLFLPSSLSSKPLCAQAMLS